MTLSTQDYLRTAAEQCRAAGATVNMAPETALGIANVLDRQDARTAELLEANNREVDSKRAIRRQLEAAQVTVDALSREVLDLRQQIRRLSAPK